MKKLKSNLCFSKFFLTALCSLFLLPASYAQNAPVASDMMRSVAESAWDRLPLHHRERVQSALVRIAVANDPAVRRAAYDVFFAARELLEYRGDWILDAFSQPGMTEHRVNPQWVRFLTTFDALSSVQNMYGLKEVLGSIRDGMDDDFRRFFDDANSAVFSWVQELVGVIFRFNPMESPLHGIVNPVELDNAIMRAITELGGMDDALMHLNRSVNYNEFSVRLNEAFRDTQLLALLFFLAGM